jgi:chemotaxis protein histidine kinase CheA
MSAEKINKLITQQVALSESQRNTACAFPTPPTTAASALHSGPTPASSAWSVGNNKKRTTTSAAMIHVNAKQPRSAGDAIVRGLRLFANQPASEQEDEENEQEAKIAVVNEGDEGAADADEVEEDDVEWVEDAKDEEDEQEQEQKEDEQNDEDEQKEDAEDAEEDDEEEDEEEEEVEETVKGEQKDEEENEESDTDDFEESDTEEINQRHAIVTNAPFPEAHVRQALIEILAKLQRLCDKRSTRSRARTAAQAVMRVIYVVLAQDTSNWNTSLGQVLLARHGCDLPDLFELINEDIAERFAISHWEYLDSHDLVDESASEFLLRILMFVPITLENMLDCMVRHFGAAVPELPPPTESDDLGSDSSTSDESHDVDDDDDYDDGDDDDGDDDDDSASSRTRAFIAPDDETISYMSSESDSDE